VGQQKFEDPFDGFRLFGIDSGKSARERFFVTEGRSAKSFFVHHANAQEANVAYKYTHPFATQDFVFGYCDLISREKVLYDRPVASALKVARQKAGFRSAVAAAKHFGWNANTYKSQEGGARPLKHADLEKYAQAFGVSPSYIYSPDIRALEGEIYLQKMASAVDRFQSARRLKAARILAGFDSAGAACLKFLFKEPTYKSHEAGTNGFSGTVAEMYGAAFAVTPTWLMSGGLPSGLGDAIDRNIVEFLKNPIDFRSSAKIRPADLRRVEELKSIIAAQKRDASTTLVEVPEFELAILSKQTDWARSNPRSKWTIPVLTLGREIRPWIVVSSDTGTDIFETGVSVFVDTTNEEFGPTSRYLAIVDDQPVLLRGNEDRLLTSGTRVIGKVVGRFSRER
jgi:hypothetical protein